jgi:pyruvate carboxylase
VLDDYIEFRRRFGDVSLLETKTYFYGMEIGEEIQVEIEAGKTLVIRLDAVGEAHDDGTRTVFFELNGQGRQVVTRDRSSPPPWKRAARPTAPIRDTSPRRCRAP